MIILHSPSQFIALSAIISLELTTFDGGKPMANVYLLCVYYLLYFISVNFRFGIGWRFPFESESLNDLSILEELANFF